MNAASLFLILISITNTLQLLNYTEHLFGRFYNLISAPIKTIGDYMPKEKCLEREPNEQECCIVITLRTNHLSHCTMVNDETKLAEQYLVYNEKVLFRQILSNGEICLYVRLLKSTLCIKISHLKITYTPPLFFHACFGFSFMVHTLEYYSELQTICHGDFKPPPRDRVQQYGVNCLKTNNCETITV